MVDYTKPSPSPSATSTINLTKGSPTISLTKAGSASGKMRINLNWDTSGRQPQQKKWFSGVSSAVDLDLGCLFEFKNGYAGVVQALGKSFGSFDYAPFIYLDGDDRTGGNASGENLYINLAHANEFSRILVFAFIYEGAPSWDRAEGVVTLYPAQGAPIEIKVDEYANGSAMCAIAMLENLGGELIVTREIKYASGHQQLDAMYGWGMSWVAGSK